MNIENQNPTDQQTEIPLVESNQQNEETIKGNEVVQNKEKGKTKNPKQSNTVMRKRIVFVTQPKGGSGKSALVYLGAEKNPDAIVFDMDDATKTTSNQLAYRSPIFISFLDEYGNIDRAVFDNFIEKVTQSEKQLFICDLGASTSEQLPNYLADRKDSLPEILEHFNIDLELFVVLGGKDIFVPTMTNLDQLVKACDGKFNITVFKNKYFSFTSEQENAANSYCELAEIPIRSYFLISGTSQTENLRVQSVLTSGKGVESADIFSKIPFATAIKALEF